MLSPYLMNRLEAAALIEIADNLSQRFDVLKNTEQIIAYLNQEKTSLYLKFPGLKAHISGSENINPSVPFITQIPEYKHPALISLILSTLSERAIIKEYDHGVWIKTIESSISLSKKMDRPSSKDSKKFYLHTDLSYTETPPAAFAFHCLHNDITLGGQTILCNLQEILPKITQKNYKELQKNQFIFPAPAYYGKSARVIHSIITKTPNEGDVIRYRQDDLYALTLSGINAIAELKDLIDQRTFFVQPEQNSILFINNRKYLHGRQSYLLQTPRQRFFNQIYLK